MATTEELKNGGSTSYPFSIEYIEASDIKVEIDGTPLTYTTNTNPTSGQYKVVGTTVTLGATAAAGTGNVHIYRVTSLDTAAAVFAAGSSIRAKDLNDSYDQIRFASQEQHQLIRTPDLKDSSVTTDKIKDGTIVDADISGSAAIAHSKIATGLLPSTLTVNSDNIVNGSIVNDDISNSANINGSKLLDDSVPLTKFGAGTLPNDIVVTRDNIQNGTIQDGDIETGTLDNRYYTETELDNGQLDNRYFTETELSNGAIDTRYYTETELNPTASLGANVLDARYYTETEAEGLFLRQDSSETIKSGDTWSGTDLKVATTAAIDARIIDLLDDTGGFVPLANETSFPTANPDINNGNGTVVSVKAVSTNLTPSGTTVTIANGAGTGNTVTITGVTGVIPQGFGMILETTSTLHTYAFHRLQAKATEVNTVATNITQVVACGDNLLDIYNFADLYQISTTAPTKRADNSSLQNGDLWFDSSANQVMMVYDGSAGDGFSPITPNQATIAAINSVSGHVTYMEDLGLVTEAINTGSGNNSINTVGANIAAVNTVAADLNETTSEIEVVANNITNVNNVGNDIANVNAVANNATNINAVQTNASNINAVNANASNINTVAGINADVTAVATNNANITAVKNNETNINAVKNNATNINAVNANKTNIDAVAANNANITAVKNNETNINAVKNNETNINAVAGNNTNITAVKNNETNINAAVSNATNINSAVSNASNINAAVSNATNINTVAGSIADVNRYAAEYVIQSGTPSSPSVGDLWYNSTSNALYYFNNTAWVGITPGITALFADPNPSLSNHLDCNDKNLTEVGTVSGNNLQIDFGTL